MQIKYPKITISGLSGIGKGTIASLLIDFTGFEKVSFGDFARETAKEMGVTLNELDELSINDQNIDLERDRHFKEYGETHKNFIAEGRLAAHFIKDSFKILLLCDDRRFSRIAVRDNITVEKAKQETLHREGTYHERYGTLYNLADFDDPKYYDLVIDTSELSPEEILNKIIQKIT